MLYQCHDAENVEENRFNTSVNVWAEIWSERSEDDDDRDDDWQKFPGVDEHVRRHHALAPKDA